MSVENPESEGQEYSLAPAEGQHPINIMTDPKFELMCNPDKLPFGLGGFNCERCRKITYRKYFQQHLLDVVGRFSCDLDYLFIAQYYIVESKQVFYVPVTTFGDKGQQHSLLPDKRETKQQLLRVFVRIKHMAFLKMFVVLLHIINTLFMSYWP